MVDNLGIDFIFSDFSESKVLAELNFPHSKRIEFRWGHNCRCGRCPEESCADRTAPRREYGRISAVSPHVVAQSQSLLDHVRFQIILLDLPHGYVGEEIHFASHLTAFDGWSSDLDCQRRLQENSVFGKLTHLSLFMAPSEVKSAYQFPCLRFMQVILRLSSWDKPSTSPYVPLWKWNLPRLVSLVLRGHIEPAYIEDLEQFLYSHTSTVEDLVIDHRYRIYDQYYQFDMDLIRRFLRLRTLGLQIPALVYLYKDLGMEKEKEIHTAVAPICKSLLLDNVLYLIGPRRDVLQSYAETCVRVCTPTTALFERITIVYSWEELCAFWERKIALQKARKVFGTQKPPVPVVFFETIYESGITFVDREGIDLREGSGLKFLERMREVDRDPGV
ncbi:hypothetical protein FRC15_004309 [Serendipita sp. 397]|nr:hypothetical protein FRC15_004309 [Serendipita sp. 397]